MLQEGHEQLDCGRCCDGSEARTRDRTHLIKCAIGQRLMIETSVNFWDSRIRKERVHLRGQRYRCSSSTPAEVLRLEPCAPHDASRGRCRIQAQRSLRSGTNVREHVPLAIGIARTLPFAAPSTVGSQRLSRESISRKMASCSSTSFSSTAISALACSVEPGGIG